jgi:hypothetical protein
MAYAAAGKKPPIELAALTADLNAYDSEDKNEEDPNGDVSREPQDVIDDLAAETSPGDKKTPPERGLTW